MKKNKYSFLPTLILWGMLIFFAEALNAQPTVRTLVGDTAAGNYDSKGFMARFGQPQGLVVMPDGTLFIIDKQFSAVKKCKDRLVTKFSGYEEGKKDGLLKNACFNKPGGITADKLGNLYVADTWNHVIRKIATDGTVSTMAINRKDFALLYPYDVAVDDSLNVYITDSGNHRIVKVNKKGNVIILAGGQQGYVNGTGYIAQFSFPKGIIVGDSNSLYVADSWNNCIRKISSKGIVTTLAGNARPFYADGPAMEASFHFPTDLAMDKRGNLYVADDENHSIRVIDRSGYVQSLAGKGIPGYKNGKNSDALFFNPRAIAVDRQGNVYVSDQGNHCIRQIIVTNGSAAKVRSKKKR